MTDGIININKPEGWTSQDVCAKLRSRLHVRRIGHTGTLDPMATGVLPVCIGKATRIIEYYDRDIKSYHASMQLGLVTDTLDITGEISEQNPFDYVTEERIIAAFAAYTGDIAQVPPKYSALKINGKRAYDLARSGAEFEMKTRNIHIFSNTVTDIDISEGIVSFDVSCSKGTYIRTICDDIGRDLGCGAAMTSLVRTGSGYFKLKDSAGLKELIEMSDDEINDLIIPMDVTLTCLGKADLDRRREKAFINGNPTDSWSYKIRQKTAFDDIYRVYCGSEFLGTGRIQGDQLIPLKVIISN